MFKLANKYFTKKAQWQMAIPAAGLGATGLAIGAGLTYNTLKNNPTDFKKLQTIPTATAAATGLAAKSAYDWGKGAINSVGNFLGMGSKSSTPTFKPSTTWRNDEYAESFPNPVSGTSTGGSPAAEPPNDPKEVKSKNMFIKYAPKILGRTAVAGGAGTGVVAGYEGLVNAVKKRQGTDATQVGIDVSNKMKQEAVTRDSLKRNSLKVK